MPLNFMNKNEKNIELITSVKNMDNNLSNNIYQYTEEGCKKYFKVQVDINYIGYVDGDNFNVINLSDSEEFDDDYKQHFAFIDENIIKKLVTSPFREKLQIKRQLREIPNFKYINFRDCHDLLDLTNAKYKINELNKSIMLKQGCEDYKLELNYVFQMETDTEISAFSLEPTTLLLCIYRGEKNCVSSLVLDYKEGEIEISSKTRDNYLKMKLNKLLRSVIIILSKIIFGEDATSVTSLAINPISAYTMIKHFNAEIIESDEDIKHFNAEIIESDEDSGVSNVTPENIKKAILEKKEVSVLLSVKLTQENIKKATDVFNNIIGNKDTDGELICKNKQEIKKRGGRRRRKSRRKKSRRKSRRKKSRRKSRRKKSHRKSRRKKSHRKQTIIN